MRFFPKVMVMAIVAIAVVLSPAPAAAQADIFKDLLAKGREAVNNFEYKAGETTAYQLLAMELTRQQRIDALELLVASVFPDDAAAQRPDSARSVIAKLVELGVQKMTTPELTWRGLDSLYTVVAATAPASGVTAIALAGNTRSAVFDSIPGIVALVAGGMRQDQIVERVNIDCAGISFEQLDAALRRARAPGGLSDGLKRTCSKLLVETDPPGALLNLNNLDLGEVPERGHLRWVQPQQAAELRVVHGTNQAARTVEIPRGRLLQAKFFLPRDTLAWPVVRSPIQIAEDLRLYEGFQPSTARPRQPVHNRGMNAFAYGMIWGVLGAAGGYAAGQFLPATGCVSNYTVPQGEYWRVNGKRYSGGQTVNLGGGMTCTATIAGASGLGMWTLTSLIKTGKNRGATRRYNEAVKAYPTVVKNWEESERRTYAERNADVRQAMADERVKLTQVQEDNNSIRARNAQLPEPQIFDREFTFADNPASSTAAAAAAATEVISDVDTRVPLAAAPNPDAVAIVIGNRDYAGRTPKVEFAIKDAKSMKRYLVEAFGFSEDRVILDTNATSGRMSELFGSVNDASVSRLAELAATRPAGSVDVFVFYSGHGSPAGRPSKKYLLPVDVNASRIQATSYSLDQLYKNLTALNAKSVTVAIDAGFGALSSDMFANESFGGGLEVEVGTVGGLNAQVMTAGTGDQAARWRRDQAHGLFTYFLLRGLQGSADANGDYAITAEELQNYLTANVKSYATERLSGAVQVPEIFTSNPNRVIVQLKSGT